MAAMVRQSAGKEAGLLLETTELFPAGAMTIFLWARPNASNSAGSHYRLCRASRSAVAIIGVGTRSSAERGGNYNMRGYPRRLPQMMYRTAASHVVLSVLMCAVAATGQPTSVVEAHDSSSVPTPFEPVSIEAADGGPGSPPLVVRVWGRRYAFDRGPLPTSIESQGRQLLTSPPGFELALDGNLDALAWNAPAVVQSSSRTLTLSSTAESDKASVRATTTIEYDGMIRVDMSIEPRSGTRISAFGYHLDLAPGVARWFNRHVRYDYESMNIDKTGLEGSAGEVTVVPLELEYSPTFSLGNRKVGLEWWSDDNINWSTAPDARPIRVRTGDTGTRLDIEPISRERRSEGAWEHSFALFPLPLRSTPRSWRSNRFVSWSAAREFRQDGFNYYWIAFPVHFQARHHGLPRSFRNDEQSSLRDRLAARGVGYIPYGKLTAAPSHHPKTFENAGRWAANRQRFTGPSPGERELLERNHDWSGRWYSYAVCTRNRDYLDWILEENLSALREESLDGLYFDFGSVSRMCETDPRITDRKHEEAWHYFELREFYKRLYEEMRSIAPEALLTTHTNGQPRAISAWADYNFIGEALNVVFREGRPWKAVQDRPDLYRPDYLDLRPGFLLAQIYPRVGGVTSILPEIKFARDPKNPDRIRKYQRAFLAQFLVEDVHFWFANSDHAELVRVMAAVDSFGSLDDARVLPYWSNRDSISRDPRIEITAYSKSKKLLLIVSNMTNQRISTPIEVAADLTSKSKLLWSDLESQKATKSALNEETRLTLEPRNFRVILIE